MQDEASNFLLLFFLFGYCPAMLWWKADKSGQHWMIYSDISMQFRFPFSCRWTYFPLLSNILEKDCSSFYLLSAVSKRWLLYGLIWGDASLHEWEFDVITSVFHTECHKSTRWLFWKTNRTTTFTQCKFEPDWRWGCFVPSQVSQLQKVSQCIF